MPSTWWHADPGKSTVAHLLCTIQYSGRPGQGLCIAQHALCSKCACTHWLLIRQQLRLVENADAEGCIAALRHVCCRALITP